MSDKEKILSNLSEIRSYFEETPTPDPILEWGDDINMELNIMATDAYIKVANL